MLKSGGFAEGESAPRFSVAIKGVMQEGGFNTYDEAYASVKHLIQGVHVQIWQGRKLVFGTPLPDYLPPRPGDRKPRPK